LKTNDTAKLPLCVLWIGSIKHTPKIRFQNQQERSISVRKAKAAFWLAASAGTSNETD